LVGIFFFGRTCSMSCTRMAVVMTAALTFLRIVIGLHFFLEG
jgi:hypothetical protein